MARLAPIALFIAKFKFILIFLLKFKFLLSLFAFFGLYWAEFGWKFGLGFTALIFIHEMGHFVDVKRRGLPAEMPVFLPGFGAYVKWQALGVSEEVRAEISLAGPFAGLLAAIACAGVWWYNGGSQGIMTPIGSLFVALAAIGAWLNAINLIPVYILDGGQAIHALNRDAQHRPGRHLRSHRLHHRPVDVLRHRCRRRLHGLHRDLAQGRAGTIEHQDPLLLHRAVSIAGTGDVPAPGPRSPEPPE